VNPLCFVRAHLQRRLFAWFGATIVFTGVTVAAVMHLDSERSTSFQREVNHVRALAGGQFARVWDDPRARTTLAKDIQRDLEVTVELEGAHGEPLGVFGPRCSAPSLHVPVVLESRHAGEVRICAERYHSRPLRAALPIFVALTMLWGASGAIARRLSRPFGELARVAQELGSGNFKARARIGRHHHGEAASLALAINDMAARIERHVGEQRELLAVVSHELRTPLSRIRLLVEMARGQGSTEKMLDELEQEIIEIDALVGDLLASSRLDFGALSLAPEDAAMAAVRALERVGADVGALDVEEEGLRVKADATLLGRALANLIENANKHGGGVLSLRVARAGDRVAFVVEDQGAGLPEGEEERIVEPFYRRSKEGSLGLGLSLVKRIAEAHGGRAFAENRSEGGARVGIELPSASA